LLSFFKEQVLNPLFYHLPFLFSFWAILNTICFNIVASLLLFSHICAAVTDPGLIPLHRYTVSQLASVQIHLKALTSSSHTITINICNLWRFRYFEVWQLGVKHACPGSTSHLTELRLTGIIYIFVFEIDIPTFLNVIYRNLMDGLLVINVEYIGHRELIIAGFVDGVSDEWITIVPGQ
uniref:Transmembrane protein n=1 Tax=Schistosoma curassoni TaxID=6186 RepID=A0A183KI70_9TREM